MATAYSSGNMKPDSWNRFLDSIYKPIGEEINVSKTLESMKKGGFDIEER